MVIKMAYEIYYNGVQEIFEVEFDDDTYHFTGNHKLLVLRNNKEEWVEVQYLSEEDLVIDIKSMKKIKSIRRVGSDHTWDLTVDEMNIFCLTVLFRTTLQHKLLMLPTALSLQEHSYHKTVQGWSSCTGRTKIREIKKQI